MQYVLLSEMCHWGLQDMLFCWLFDAELHDDKACL